MDAKLRLVQFWHAGVTSVGVELSDGGPVVDICNVESPTPVSMDMKTFIKNWDNSVKMALQYVYHSCFYNIIACSFCSQGLPGY